MCWLNVGAEHLLRVSLSKFKRSLLPSSSMYHCSTKKAVWVLPNYVMTVPTSELWILEEVPVCLLYMHAIPHMPQEHIHCLFVRETAARRACREVVQCESIELSYRNMTSVRLRTSSKLTCIWLLSCKVHNGLTACYNRRRSPYSVGSLRDNVFSMRCLFWYNIRKLYILELTIIMVRRSGEEGPLRISLDYYGIFKLAPMHGIHGRSCISSISKCGRDSNFRSGLAAQCQSPYATTVGWEGNNDKPYLHSIFCLKLISWLQCELFT